MLDLHKNYLEENQAELEQLLFELCKIPAPQDQEEQRARFCEQWLKEQGAEGIFIDSAMNVIYPYQVKKGQKLIVLMAHMDTVFSKDTKLRPHLEKNHVCCPGVGDDTANLAILLMLAKYVAKYQPKMPHGIVFVADTGEEGLGNLKGSKEVIHRYKDQIEYVISFDLHYDSLINKAVGSVRYRVEATTKGGHSYSDFGTKNAITVLSDLIHDLYQQPINETDSKTTYNVGTIEGGTTINCIANKASMTYEIRSDSATQLDKYQKNFLKILSSYQSEEVNITLTQLGLRPCMKGVNQKKQEELSLCYANILSQYLNKKIPYVSASTDCNIPLSEGIPAICFGLCDGGGVHTEQEYIERESLKTGFEIGLSCLSHMELA